MPKEGKKGGRNKNVLIVRIIGSSVSVVGSTVAIVGAVAAPFTAGASLIPAYLAGAGTAVSWAGGLTSCIAYIVQFILDRLEDNEFGFLEQLVNIIKARGLTPRERLEAVNALFKKVSCIAEKAAKESTSLAPGGAIAQGCKAAKAADKARKAANVSSVLDVMLECPVVRVNGLSMLFSLVDLIDAWVRFDQLSKST